VAYKGSNLFDLSLNLIKTVNKARIFRHIECKEAL